MYKAIGLGQFVLYLNHIYVKKIIITRGLTEVFKLLAVLTANLPVKIFGKLFKTAFIILSIQVPLVVLPYPVLNLQGVSQGTDCTS